MNNLLEGKTSWFKKPITKKEVWVALTIAILSFITLFFQLGNYPEVTSATGIVGVMLIFFVSLLFYDEEYKKIPRNIIWGIIALVVGFVLINLVLIKNLNEQKDYTPSHYTYGATPKITTAQLEK